MIHILTVDSSVARLYEVTGTRPPLKEIVDFGNEVASLHERDLVTSRPGRSLNRSAGIHQAFEPASAKQVATHRWLKDMSALLGSLIGGTAGGLVVVASPRLQAELQPLLPASLRRKQVVQYGRNLSGLSATRLAERLAATIATMERRLGEPRIRQAVSRAGRSRISAQPG